jgi:hypothetical protein
MNMRKTLCLTAWNRPEYLRRCLDSLKCCVGIKEYVLVCNVEPGCQPVVDMLKDVQFCDVDVVINPEQYGISKNRRRVMARGLAISKDWTSGIEDDIEFSPDALRFIEWAIETCGADKTNFDIGLSKLCLRGKFIQLPTSDPSKVHKREIFSPLGWAIWADRLEKLLAIWDERDEWQGAWGWDFQADRAREKWGPWEVFPEVARSLHFGVNGLHMDASREWHNQYMRTENFLREPYDGPYVGCFKDGNNG